MSDPEAPIDEQAAPETEAPAPPPGPQPGPMAPESPTNNAGPNYVFSW